jgi:hypothetical protein
MSSPLRVVLFALLLIAPVLYAQSDSGFVRLVSGERRWGHVEWNRPIIGSSSLSVDDSIEIPIDSVARFQNSDGFFGRVAGTSATIVLRTSHGRLDCFKELAGTWHPGTPPPPLLPQSVVFPVDYFSKNDGDILDAGYGNLSLALADSPVSMAHLARYRTMNFIQWGLLGTGFSLVVLGFAESEPGTSETEIIVTGAVLGLAAWIPYFLKKGELEEAIEEYNRE